MLTSMREGLAEILRLAIAAYDAKIAELQDRREQLVRLINKASAGTAAKTPATQKTSRLSAAARTKISAAQKARWEKARKEKAKKHKPNSATKAPQARWEKARKEKAKKHKPNSATKAAQSKTEFVKAVPVPSKAKRSSTEKASIPKNVFAKEILTLPKEETSKPQTPKPDINTPAGIIEQMVLAGARFRITRGGSLIVGNLGSLPPAVQQMFIDYPDPRLLTAAARRHLASADQISTQ
jgi:hypothetical protein